MAERPTISVVVPVYNEAACLPKLHAELVAVCNALPYGFEFVFVNDGSTDDTDEVLGDLRRRDGRVCYLALSRNFGHQGALSAGLAFAAGDAVIMMDGDLQHPPSLLPRLLECWASGYDIVNTTRVETLDSSLSKKLLSRAFYWVFRTLTRLPIEPGSADFRLMSREAVDALNALPERHRFIRGLVPWLGYRQTSVSFQAPARWAGRPKYTLGRSLRLALEGITAFSLYPLRFVTVFGLIVMAASFGWGSFAVLTQVLGGPTASGSTSLLICLHFLGGCQLAALGIIGEYLGRALEQVKGRPLYIVRSARGLSKSRHREGAAIPPHHLSFAGVLQAREQSRLGRSDVERGD
jgi:dolichol-phosphate mannosyltransferase